MAGILAVVLLYKETGVNEPSRGTFKGFKTIDEIRNGSQMAWLG
jgi:hypothetical protein